MQPMQPMQPMQSPVMNPPGGSTSLSMGGSALLSVGGGMTGVAAGDGTPMSKGSDGKNRMPGDLKESLAGLMTAVQRTLREQEDGHEEMDVLTQLDQMRRDPSPMIGGARRGLYAQSRSPSRAHSPQVDGLGRIALSGARKSSQEPRMSADSRSTSFDMASGSNSQPAWAQPREGSFVGNRGKIRSESANQRRQSPMTEPAGKGVGRGSSTLPIGPGPAQNPRGNSFSTHAADAAAMIDPQASPTGGQSPTSTANVRSTSGSVRTSHPVTNRQSLMSQSYGAPAQPGQATYTPQVSTQVLRARGATPMGGYTPSAATRSVRPSM